MSTQNTMKFRSDIERGNSVISSAEISSTNGKFDSITTVFESMKDKKKNSLKSFLLNFIYPIGSIYISIDPTNPKDLFGGEWQSFGAGRTLIGVDTTQAYAETVEKTDGSAHTKLVKHTHTIKNTTANLSIKSTDDLTGYIQIKTTDEDGVRMLDKSGGKCNISYGQDSDSYSIDATGTAYRREQMNFNFNHTHEGSTTHTHTAETAGDIERESNYANLPPYITCYFWKRTG